MFFQRIPFGLLFTFKKCSCLFFCIVVLFCSCPDMMIKYTKWRIYGGNTWADSTTTQWSAKRGTYQEFGMNWGWCGLWTILENFVEKLIVNRDGHTLFFLVALLVCVLIPKTRRASHPYSQSRHSCVIADFSNQNMYSISLPFSQEFSKILYGQWRVLPSLLQQAIPVNHH